MRGKISIAGMPINMGGSSDWDSIENKPFSTVDTENGLTIQDDTLMIDTLDKIATIDYVDEATSQAYDYVDQKVAQVEQQIPVDYVDTATFNTLQQQVDAAEQDIADIQSDFATKQELAEAIPTNVSQLTNDAGYVTYSEAQQEIAALPDMTTIGWDSNNKLTVIGGGGSVEIDNKSIIKNANNEIQTAVPIYTEENTIENEYGPGLYFDSGFSYPANIDLDVTFSAPNGFSLSRQVGDEDMPPYRLAVKLTDGRVFDGPWTASADYGYDYGGDTWNTNGTFYQMYISNESADDWKLHIYMNGDYIYGEEEEGTWIGNVESICLYQTEEVTGYDLEQTCTDNNLTYSSIYQSRTITTVHKLPNEYVDIDNDTLFINSITEKLQAKRIQGENNISVNTYTDEEGNPYYAISYNGGDYVDFVGGKIFGDFYNYLEGYLDNPGNNPFYCHNFLDDTSSNSWFIRIQYHNNQADAYMDTQTIYGKLIETYDSSVGHPVLTSEGLDSVLESITYGTDTDSNPCYIFTLKNEYSFSANPSTTESSPATDNNKQYINSYFLPIDNSTIKVNSDGNIYADSQGGSVDIDNKSIVENQQGQIETAVKLYKEDVTTTYNAIKGWTANGRYLYAQNNPYAIYLRGALTNTGSALYTIIVNFDFENQNYQLSGVCNSIGSMLTNNFLWGKVKEHFDGFGVSNSTGNSAQLYTHAYSGSAYTINWVVVKEADYNATYSDTDEDVVEAVYNKLPVDYIPVDNAVIQEDSNGNLSLAHDFLLDMITVGTGLNSGPLNAYKYPNYHGVSISLSQNPSLRATIASQGLRPVVGGAHSGAAGGSVSQNVISFTRTNSVNVIQSTTNMIFNNYPNSYVWIGLYYNYTGMNNPDYSQNAPYQIIGRVHVGDITNDKTDFSIEGCEGVLESAVYDSSISKYVFTFKQDIYPALNPDVWYLSQVQYRPLNDKYQKINSFFLPLDNSTIKRDSDGNITTAIPAPPTTDGNYTLAVTVTNGVPSYSWV